jgi:hypothetical protein
MLSNTSSHYKSNYKANLSDYLKKYEDNTEAQFFKNDLDDYTKYYHTLKKISDFIKTSPKQYLSHYPIMSNIGLDLKIINKTVFDEIILEKKADPEYDEDEFRPLLYPGSNPPTIEINIKNLNNRITSARQILKFISEQLTISLRPNKNASALNLTGELSQGTTEQHSSVPDNEIIVEDRFSTEPKKSKDTDELEANDHTKETVEEYLEDIVDDIKPKDFKILVDALYCYFTTNKFPILENKIMFNSVNKKKVGWALKQVYKNIKTKPLDIEYFRFAKENINLFSDEVIESTNFTKSKFYKMFTTNPAN